MFDEASTLLEEHHLEISKPVSEVSSALTQKFSELGSNSTFKLYQYENWRGVDVNTERQAGLSEQIRQGDKTDWHKCYETWEKFDEVISGFGGKILKVHVHAPDIQVKPITDAMIDRMQQMKSDDIPFCGFKVDKPSYENPVGKPSDFNRSIAIYTVGPQNAADTVRLMSEILTPIGVEPVPPIDLVTEVEGTPGICIGQFDRIFKLAAALREPWQFYQLFPLELGGGLTQDMAWQLEDLGVKPVNDPDRYKMTMDQAKKHLSPKNMMRNDLTKLRM